MSTRNTTLSRLRPFGVASVLWIAAFNHVAAQNSGGLKILVLQGEEGINIIQQKTAVAPIVEVRDRNNLPVAGASIAFLLELRGGDAVFSNGLRLITLTTDATGRASTVLTPLASGPFDIQITAAYQGMTASVSIPQTNFATVAEAARAAASSGTSPAEGASQGTTKAGSSAGATSAATGGAAKAGGLSGWAIAGIAGGAVSAGLVAIQAGGGSDSPPTLATSAPAPTSTPTAPTTQPAETTVSGTVSGSSPVFAAVPGVTVTSGRTLRITASGTICADSPGCAANASPNGSGRGNGDSTARLPGVPVHSLICGIGAQGASDLFFVGSNFSAVAARSGPLFCGLNEQPGIQSAYNDNRGSWSIVVTFR